MGIFWYAGSKKHCKKGLNMRGLWKVLIAVLICLQAAAWSNSVTLLNDTPYTLQATIYDANGTLLGEFTINSREATLWSDDYENFGMESQYASQVPYTVNWYCMNGNAYGTCEDVAAGATVTAQSCGGDQECPEQQMQPY
jgi:hypothetical protein